MRKLILAGLILLLVGCEKEQVTLIEDQTEAISQTEVSYGDGLWYKGYLDHRPVELQLTTIETRVIGQYVLNGESGSFSGELLDDYMVLNEDDRRWILYTEGDRVFGAVIAPDSVGAIQATKDNQAHQIIGLSDSKSLMSGTYYEEAMTRHEGSEVRIEALFDHMIYVNIRAYNGIYNSSFDFLAVEENGAYQGLLDHLDLQIVFDRYDLVVDANHYKMDQGLLDFAKHYSESHRPKPVNLAELGIFLPEDLVFYENLLKDDFKLLAENCQIYAVDGDYIKVGLVGNPYLIEIYKEDGYQYVHLSPHLFDNQQSKLYTNDLDNLPVKVLKWQSSDVITRRAMTDHGFEVPLFGSLTDFIGTYSIVATAEGLLDRDSFMDMAMVLEGPNERVLLVLKGSQDLFKLDLVTNRLFESPDLDLFEDLKIEDNQLRVSYYGGDQIREGRTFIFDATKGYLMTQMILKTHAYNSFKVTEIQYDLVTDDVRLIQGDSILPFEKTTHEEIYLHQFDVKEGIDETYR